MGELRLTDIVICGAVVVLVVIVLGTLCWSVDQAVQYGHSPGISHTGRSRRRACVRDSV